MWGASVKRLVGVVVAIAALVAGSSAHAVDMPHKAPVAATATSYNWSGLYVGINGGFGTGETSAGLLPSSFFGNHDVSGGMFGGQIGFNYQWSHLVLGVEADLDWASLTGSETIIGLITEEAKTTSVGTLRARFGYAWDRVMVYGTGGFAWGRVSDGCDLCGVATETNTLTGYTVGAGVEYGITPDLSAKAEYIYVHLDPSHYFIDQGCVGDCSMGANIKLFRLGVNWRFYPWTSAYSANAASLRAKVASADPHDWSGLYVGLNGGYGAGKTTGDLLPNNFFGNEDVDGGLFGGQIGFNYQISHLILGVETDLDWANVHGSNAAGGFTDEAKVKTLGTVRGRIGYAWDNIMLYGTGGFAWGRLSDGCDACGVPEEVHTLAGYTVGAGIEYGITTNLSARAEYLYVHLDPTDYFTLAGFGCVGGCSLGSDVNIVRLGLNWRLAGSPF
jgi:outer membrane immunogenic protein